MTLPTKATHQQTGVHNERLVVRPLYDLGPISRAAVARLTGLTGTTVSDLVASLLDEGVVREIGRGRSSGPDLVRPSSSAHRRSPWRWTADRN